VTSESHGPGEGHSSHTAVGSRVERIELSEFRCYTRAELTPAVGLTAVIGSNGEGKTNLLEAIAYLSRQQSFRGAAPESMVRAGAERAVIRGQVSNQGRDLLIEAELAPKGRPRVLLNRQRVTRRAELLDAFQVSAFSPDDLELVKGGPSVRRAFLDELVVACHPRNDSVVSEVERVLKQRNALLKQLGGRLNAEAELTLAVWDERLAHAGERLAGLRIEVVDRLRPKVAEAYDQLAGRPSRPALSYESEWAEAGLAGALSAARRDDVRRGVSTVGPHRDELAINLAGRPARQQASQGEQRSLSFGLRLAAHRIVTEELGAPPTLLLDDVFSELDPDRSSALLRALPPGQTVLTSAVGLPAGAEPELVVTVRHGQLS
jgi:DNA replication and repair protein RecF